MSGKTRALLAVALLVPLVAGACDTRAGWEREVMGRAYFDSTGAYANAGVSTRIDPDIQPLRLRALGADTTERAFHLFSMRCGACHQVPDPRMKTAEHWSFLLPRMRGNAESAGLIPMTRAEADSILDFLGEHARR